MTVIVNRVVGRRSRGGRGLWTTQLVLVLVLVSDVSAAPATPLTDRAVETIRRQATHMARGNPSMAPEYFTALAIANFVQARVSSLNYAVLKTEKLPLPSTVEECLQKKAGICGNHVAVFLEISRRLKLRARPVEFYFRGETPKANHSHICVEVFYRGAWRLFDVTWGTYYRIPGDRRDHLADVTRLRSSRFSRKWAVTNESDLWYQQWVSRSLDPLEYLDAPRLDILRGRRGTIHLRESDRDGGVQRFQPIHQPNFVGRNDSNRDYGPVSVVLECPDSQARTVSMDVLGLAGSGALVVICGKTRIEVPFAQITGGQQLNVPLRASIGNQPVRLETHSSSPKGVAYVVFRFIEVGP